MQVTGGPVGGRHRAIAVVRRRRSNDAGARVRPTSGHRLPPTCRRSVVLGATSAVVLGAILFFMSLTRCRGSAMLRLLAARMPFVPPQVRYPAASAGCAEPVSRTSSGTSQEYSQSAVKLAARLEPGRAGPAGQCTFTPSVALGATCVSDETQTDLLKWGELSPSLIFLTPPNVRLLITFLIVFR